MDTSIPQVVDPASTEPIYQEIDQDEARYEGLIKTVQEGYHCSRGKARRIIKSILRKTAKKISKQKKVN